MDIKVDVNAHYQQTTITIQTPTWTKKIESLMNQLQHNKSKKLAGIHNEQTVMLDPDTCCRDVFGLASLIFDTESWSPLKQTTVHFFLSVVVFFPIILTAGWVPFAVSPLLICLVVFVFIYIVIWCLMYLYHRNQLKQLNNELR